MFSAVGCQKCRGCNLPFFFSRRATANSNKPLSYEELLDKPFYTVEGDTAAAGDGAGGGGDLAASVDYRTMMQVAKSHDIHHS